MKRRKHNKPLNRKQRKIAARPGLAEKIANDILERAGINPYRVR